MFIRVRKNLQPNQYEVLAVNLNASQRITIHHDRDQFQLLLDTGLEPAGDSQILIENYKTYKEALDAFDKMMDAYKDGCHLWDARKS